MQEIDALEIELKRLKEVKAINKEFRRFACMPKELQKKGSRFCNSICELR